MFRFVRYTCIGLFVAYILYVSFVWRVSSDEKQPPPEVKKAEKKIEEPKDEEDDECCVGYLK
jgi:hypothetical protein